MGNKSFNNRVYGCAIVKEVNSNYNADFSGLPRTLPSGVAYATDKAFKYTIRNYFKKFYPNEKIFFFQTPKLETGNPMSLDDKYNYLFPENKDKKDKKTVNLNLLSCLDVRLFGATYANNTKKVNVSIHGPVQINHGMNLWDENNIFSEQIKSPFADPSSKKADDKEAAMTTIGRQSKLEEGHYLHHFSINPNNLNDSLVVAGEKCIGIGKNDIKRLKKAMRMGATFYDSAAKAGTDNELLFWVELKEESKLVLPNFTELVDVKKEKKEGKVVYDFYKLTELLERYSKDISKIELFANWQSVDVVKRPEKSGISELFGNDLESF